MQSQEALSSKRLRWRQTKVKDPCILSSLDARLTLNSYTLDFEFGLLGVNFQQLSQNFI